MGTKEELAIISFDVFAVSSQGFKVHFQLRGERVYEDAVKLLERLEKDGFKLRTREFPPGPRGALTPYTITNANKFLLVDLLSN